MVYLLHFHEPFKHAKHYLGFVTSAENLNARMDYHKTGRGSKLMGAISKAEIGFSIARVWDKGTRDFERLLKNQKNTPLLCPICNPKALERAKGDGIYVAPKNVPDAESPGGLVTDGVVNA